MKQGRAWIERLADAADLQGEAFPNQPLVELFADRRVLIENHCGVTEYGRERIQVRMKYGMLSVCGRCLELARMTGEQLVITGWIDGIQLRRN